MMKESKEACTIFVWRSIGLSTEQGGAPVKQQTLNIRFHNPNTSEDTADYLLKLLSEANQKKLEQALQEIKVSSNKLILEDQET